MRIVRFQDDRGEIRYGEQVDDHTASALSGDLFNLKPTGMKATISRLLSPILPVNIFCIGANYAAHAREEGREPPALPIIFMKPTTAVTNPGDPIRIPRTCRPEGEVDYEAELAVIIGKPGRDIPESQALSHVFGYCCANDVSARHWQKQGGGGQWIRGKSFDTFCPLGPAIVTADEVADPQKLEISMTINGERLQQSNTSYMIFTVAYLISFISRDTTLAPGTIILTGTPEGVGNARKPPRWLVPGDAATVEIAGIGRLTNPVTGHG